MPSTSTWRVPALSPARLAGLDEFTATISAPWSTFEPRARASVGVMSSVLTPTYAYDTLPLAISCVTDRFAASIGIANAMPLSLSVTDLRHLSAEDREQHVRSAVEQDARTAGSALHHARIHAAEKTSRFGAEQIGVSDGDVVTRNREIEIVLQRQRDRILEAALEDAQRGGLGEQPGGEVTHAAHQSVGDSRCPARPGGEFTRAVFVAGDFEQLGAAND